MIDFYDTLIETSYELLKEFGQSLTISRKVTGAYDPATGQASVTTTTQTGFGAILPYKGINFAAESLIRLGDQQLLLAPTGITEPMSGDFVTAGETTYTVTNIKHYRPGGIMVLYDINLRGA